jgi:hypothetical protein
MLSYRLSSIFGTLVCIVLLTLTGCTPCSYGYKEVTADNSIARFSFEYPCDWKFGVIKSSEYDTFTVEAPHLRRDDLYIKSTYWVFEVARAGERSLQNATAALNYELSLWMTWPNFKVLESSEVEINGVTAQQRVIAYEYRPLGIGVRPYIEELELKIRRYIYFDYKGFIWMISASSNSEVTEEHKVHFEHMLQTFNIFS